MLWLTALFSYMLFPSHREKQAFADMVYFICLYFGKPCYVCKELGLPADAVQWTEEHLFLSIPGMVTIGVYPTPWWPVHPELGLFLNIIRCLLLEFCSKVMVFEIFFFSWMFTTVFTPLKIPFCLSGLLKTAESITNCCIHLHKLHEQRPLYIPTKVAIALLSCSPHQEQNHLCLRGVFAAQLLWSFGGFGVGRDSAWETVLLSIII